MYRTNSSSDARVSYDKYGSGPPLVLVHGSFSDHSTNWEFVAPLLSRQFTVYAVARRGRGETDASEVRSVEDEAGDVAAVMREAGEPVFLLGHSYGALVALEAAVTMRDSVRKLILYEGPRPDTMTKGVLDSLERLARAGDWDRFAVHFFRDVLTVPVEEVESVRASELWPPIVADAVASFGDLRALSRYEFGPERFRHLRAPVLLQTRVGKFARSIRHGRACERSYGRSGGEAGRTGA